MQQTFFSSAPEPLPARVRPQSLDTVRGQTSLIALLKKMIETDSLTSMLFWGPPGVGKTTLARLLAGASNALFLEFSAITSGTKDLKAVMQTAENARQSGRRTILFLDEIHRFNKAQQDAFLPFVERGSVILIGATTENPAFSLNAALLSRLKVLTLDVLSTSELTDILRAAAETPEGVPCAIDDESLHIIAALANGDARAALSMLETAATLHPGEPITPDILKTCLSAPPPNYDKSGDGHYNLISAFIKSMRNSDPDAALYWLARILEGGEDPRYPARRMIRFAAEDIGTADLRAVQTACAAFDAAQKIGMPECGVNLAQAAVVCALAPKSAAVYNAWNAAVADAARTSSAPVPLHLRNAPAKVLQELGWSSGYQYAHDFAEGHAPMECLPDCLQGTSYYAPTEHGQEKKIAEWLTKIRNKKLLAKQ